MTRLLLLFSFMLVMNITQANDLLSRDTLSIPYSEDFEDGIADGWQTDMTISNGVLFKNVFYYEGSNISESVTPTIGTIGSSTVLLFDYKWMSYGGGAYDASGVNGTAQLLVLVKSAESGEYSDTLHVINKDNHITSENFATVAVLLDDFEGSYVDIKFEMSVEVDSWSDDVNYYLDNVMVMNASAGTDLMVASMSTPKMVNVGDSASIGITVANKSINDFSNNYSIALSCTDGTTETINISDTTITGLSNMLVYWDWVPQTAGEYTISAKITAENDSDSSNDSICSDTVVVDYIIIVGEGQYKSSFPFVFNYQNCISQNMYYADELGSPKIISSISYLINKSGDFEDDQPIKMWLGTTDQSDMTTPININDGGFQLVFEGSANDIFTSSGNALISFDEPFVYNGGNLVVTVQNAFTTFSTTGFNFEFDYDSEGRYRTYNAFSDSEEYDVNDLPIPTKGIVSSSDKLIKAIFQYSDLIYYDAKFVVSNSETNEIIEGATVNFGMQSLTTDSLGEASFNTIQGEYDFNINLYGYYDNVGSVLISNTDTIINISLEPMPERVVTFEITDKENNQPLQNALVSVHSFEALSDENGQVSFSLVDGDFAYTVSRYNYIETSDSISIDGEDISEAVSLTYTNVLFYDNFTTHLNKWTSIDNDGDGYNWTNYTIINGMIDGTMVAASDIFDIDYNELDPDNYLVSPEIYIPETDLYQKVLLDFYVSPWDSEAPYEEYKIIASTTGSSIEDFNNGTVVIEETITEYGEYGYGFHNRVIDLSSFEGDSVHLAFVHTGGAFRILMDAFKVSIEDIVYEFDVTFNVFDKDTVAISNASITLNNTTLTTNEQGIATTQLPNGSYFYTVLAGEGFESYSDTLVISDTNVVIDVFMTDIDTTSYIASEEMQVSLYPNPTKGILYIQGDYSENATATIYSINGREIPKFKLVENNSTLDLSDYKKGFYMIEILSNYKKHVQTFVIE